MAHIDLDKVGAALLHIRDDPAGTAALQQFKTTLDNFAGGLPQQLNHPEQVMLLRTLMADLSIDKALPSANTTPAVGLGGGTVQHLGSPMVKPVHGFMIQNEK